MNDLDKKDLLELANLIKDYVVQIESTKTVEANISSILEEISGCADVIVEIVENKPHKIVKMFSRSGD